MSGITVKSRCIEISQQLKADVLEDITDLVLEGEIIIE